MEEARHLNLPVDLRSDTMTLPTDEMRRAIASAEVSKDPRGEDPTVTKLEELAAGMLGKEAAVYVPTGMMAIQIAMRVLGTPGGEVICERDSHIVASESGATAQLAWLQLLPITGVRGVLPTADVEAAVRPRGEYQMRTVAIAIENTHNAAGCTIWSRQQLRELGALARGHGLPVFCDGIRIFNAWIAAGGPLDEYVSDLDLVAICLYKGLAAPTGALLCGPSAVLEEARWVRRVFGGAIHKAGMMAAAGIVALERMVERLAEDHAHARMIADALEDALPGSVDPGQVQTNVVHFDASPLQASRVLDELERNGVLAILMPEGHIRFAANKDVDRAGIEHAVRAIPAAVAAARGS